MCVRLLTALLIALAGAGRVGAAENPAAFECAFTKGVTHVYDGGRFVEEPAAALTFGIAAINAPKQSAEIRTGGGSGILKLVHAVNATHFLEVVTEGSLHITTVFDKDDAKGAYPAVHSRHFALLGQPIVTQYQGFCQAKG
jgi:hypothetical protein